MRGTRLIGYVYDFSVDYDAIAVDDILDIHNYLMKKNESITKCLGLLKSVFLKKVLKSDFNERKYIELYFNEQSRM